MLQGDPKRYHPCNAKPNASLPPKSAWSYLPHRAESCSDERYTPSWILDIAAEVLGAIDLDPCADPQKRVPARQHFTKADDGLEKAWKGKIYLNPPYSGATKWFKHLCLYMESGAVTEAIVLVPITSLGSKGARLLMKRTANCLTLFDRSINFLDENYQEMSTTSPIPLCLIYCGNNSEKFLQITDDRGYGLVIHKSEGRHRHRRCNYCGKTYLAQRSTSNFCGTTCRVEAHREKKRQLLPTKTNLAP